MDANAASPAAHRRNSSIAAGGPPAAMPCWIIAPRPAVIAWGLVVPARMGGSWMIAARTASGWRSATSSATLPPALVPTSTAGRSPRAASRAGAAGVAAPVVGGDGEPVGERGGHPGQLCGVAAGAGDQQHRRAAAAGLGVQDRAVGLHTLDVHEVGVLGHGTAPPQSSNSMLRRFWAARAALSRSRYSVLSDHDATIRAQTARPAAGRHPPPHP